MAIISEPGPTFSPHTTAKSAEVEVKLQSLYNLVNGGLDDTNLSAIANINPSKILNLLTTLATINVSFINNITVRTYGASGNYAKTPYLRFARIIAIGGGGGGGGAQADGTNFQASCGGGGGCGAYSEAWIQTENIGASEIITIGQGGIVGGAGPTAGGDGGDTSFGAGQIVLALGGKGGGAVMSGIGNPALGGQAAPGQQLTIPGNPGFTGVILTSLYATGGQGAGGPYSVGGRGLPVGAGSAVGGENGSSGGGGSGGAVVGIGQAAGGRGGDGLVLIHEFNHL